jgi:protein-tyrosine-phosphatase
MPSILFVCTANRFRSPLAAGIFEKAVMEEEKARISSWHIGEASDWQVSSAGIDAVVQQPVLSIVLEAASQLGIDLSGHLSKRIDQVPLNNFDLIIVMEEAHKALLKTLYPELEAKFYLLSRVTENETYDIPDAFSSPQGVIGVCMVMNELIRRNLSYICVLAIALHNKKTQA